MHIHLDPVGGMAGDMFVAALLDAFPGLENVVQRAVRAAGLPDRFRCDLTSHADHGLLGKRFLVLEAASTGQGQAVAPAHDHAHDPQYGHRPFAHIREGLRAAPIAPGALDHALGIFTRLAEAEAQVHGATVETVTFHELGEWDSIADIVAAAAIIDALASSTWSVAPLPLGSGLVKSAHGLLPVPAPATTLLLRGLMVREDGIAGERVTPTGAAIARHLIAQPGEPPAERRILGTGLGFGTRSLPGISNSLRALVFDAGVEREPGDLVASIEFEVDDQTPEDLAIGLDHVRAHSQVLDVVQTPALGKKGRVVISVRVLCRRQGEDEVAALCFRETTTLGLRVLDVRRHTLARSETAENQGERRVALKHAERGREVTTKVEAESLRDVEGHAERQRLRRMAERR